MADAAPNLFPPTQQEQFQLGQQLPVQPDDALGMEQQPQEPK